MPTYSCICAKDLLTAPQKSAIAAVITSAHVDVTGAPPYFAQVVFHHVNEGDHFIGGKVLGHDHLFVYGSIRIGRSDGVREGLIKRLVKDVAAAAGVATFGVWVYLAELPPAAMAEFGHILPEPGGEEAWSESLPADERVRMQALSR